MTEPADALRKLASLLEADRSVISPHIAVPAGETPALGMLAAAGDRTSGAPGEYALVVEAVREGYLLHYDRGRVVRGTDADLALLAGDYLYALGLERLASLADLAAVRELSDLISLAAQVHDGGRSPERAAREAAALWLACATAIAVGATEALERAKAEVRADSERATDALWAATRDAASSTAMEEALREAADAIDFAPDDLSSVG